MTFAHRIKEEIMNKDFTLPKIESLINGIMVSSSRHDVNFHYVVFNNKKITNFFIENLKILNIKFQHILTKKQIIIPLSEYDIKLNFVDKTSFFAGMFLGSGSINKINSTYYHLQIGVVNEDMGNKIMEIINAYENFDFKLLKQKNNYILYIKKIDSICDFLRAIETPISYLELENKKIERDFQNNLNRQGNIDIVNINKTLKANEMFVQMYKFIKDNKLLKNFSDEQISYFKLRLKHPGASLNILVSELQKNNIKITKSGLNHWNKKLKYFYLKFKNV